MSTTITVTRKIDVEESVEVTFPVYFESYYASDNGPYSTSSFYRIAENGDTVKVAESYEGSTLEKYELEIDTTSRRDLGSMLNSVDYFRPSTQQAFDVALASAKARLDRALDA